MRLLLDVVGFFGFGNQVTREQLAAILWRYAKFNSVDVSIGDTTDIFGYADVQQVRDYAVPAFQWVCGAKIVEGKPGGYLAPQGATTRAEMTAILSRFIQH